MFIIICPEDVNLKNQYIVATDCIGHRTPLIYIFKYDFFCLFELKIWLLPCMIYEATIVIIAWNARNCDSS